MCEALQFGRQLEVEYLKRIASANSVGEVAYFNCLVSAFASLSTQFHIKICHGTSHLVEFRGRSAPWSRLNAKCEISDLMIIAFRRRPNPSMRLSFIQVKLERGHGKLQPNASNNILKANLEQWDLLSRRPSIFGVNKRFRPEVDLLSGAILPSVGSFLFLTPHGSAIPWNALYAPADMLTVRGKPTSKYSFLAASPFGIRKYSGHCEVGTLHSCSDFGIAMHMHLIGTPILDEPTARDRDYRRRARQQILGMLQNLPRSKVAQDLRKYLIEFETEIEGARQNYQLPSTLLILNTDTPRE